MITEAVGSWMDVSQPFTATRLMQQLALLMHTSHSSHCQGHPPHNDIVMIDRVDNVTCHFALGAVRHPLKAHCTNAVTLNRF